MDSFYNYVIEKHFMHLKANETPTRSPSAPNPSPLLPQVRNHCYRTFMHVNHFLKNKQPSDTKNTYFIFDPEIKPPETSADALVQDFLNSLKPVSPLMEEEKTMYSLSTDLFC